MNDFHGMCTVPAYYIETYRLPDWRLAQFCRTYGLERDDIEEIRGTLDRRTKEIIVIPAHDPGNWEIYDKTVFFDVCDLV